ncbi:MAG TPA: F0F1 ATP synthase subunit epsilon [Rhodospirillaceae bacterium]|jgi:F-type H+-transporting ATPase subunit epsilon|nr:F0F1 ATP synthase subunit epsilon [Rhodospirillaceae bacterium]MBB56909.1 F0F1 ATP synthase subunit epsilon [Rhodospirillaceae bacterium]HAE03150.1 F0F1 ATP synthase subunit epsilon [Rhodospirillaceae bacterium]HAJ19263.1 F0F1 ATP synthase subunit epsilon [Rhodospirillaceae bacterium]|tara:strand:- start:55959 stop:56375 length:417 start_codon:yes stop_codon:yes gene_type:complete
MSDKVTFELVSPEKLLFSGEVDMVVLPAAEGDMGILPGHAPVITTIRPGTICIFNGNSVEKRLFVAGGFLEVTPDRCTVLADTATPVEDIDVSAAQQMVKDCTDDVGSAKDEDAQAKARLALATAEAKLQAAQSPAYK